LFAHSIDRHRLAVYVVDMSQPRIVLVRPGEADYVVGGGAVNVVDLAACVFRLTAAFPAARIAGTSAGSYVAACIAADVKPEKVLTTFENLLQNNRALDGGMWNLVRNFGWARGEALREAAFKLVGGLTLGETRVPFGCYVSDMWAPEEGPLLLSSWTTPDVLLVDAVVASGAIPLGIQPQTIRGLGRGNRLYCDGGTGRNFPLDVFDDIPERPTIGVRVRPSQADPVTNAVRPGDWKAWSRSIFEQLLWASNHAHNSSKCRNVVVDVDCPGNALDFSLRLEDIRARWRRGLAAGQENLSRVADVVGRTGC
jgi:predicted acylesterase/phospholipase RssA